MKIFKLENKAISGYQKADRQGTGSFIVPTKELEEYGQTIDNLYGKTGLALKLFKSLPEDKSIDEFWWDDPVRENYGGPLIQASLIQNIFAIRGFAPRVLDLVKVEDPERHYYAQVTEFVEGKRGEGNTKEWKEAVEELGAKFRIKMGNDPNPLNFVGGKFTDFSLATFEPDISQYRDDVIARVNKECNYGAREESYQAVEEFEVPSQRDLKHRLEIYRFDDYDFEGKSYIDLGSSSGSFCREAARRGASRIVGIEYFPEIVEVQKDLCNLLGHKYWNIDFYNVNLSTKPNNYTNEEVYQNLVEATGQKSFDIVTFLSMVQHVLFPQYIGKFCNEWFILEGNVAQHAPMFLDDMKKYFPRVEELGYTKDHSPRVVLRGVKNV